MPKIFTAKFFFAVGMYLPEISVTNYITDFFCKTVIFDLSQTNFSKNEKKSSAEMFHFQTVTLDPPQTFILAKTKEHLYFKH